MKPYVMRLQQFIVEGEFSMTFKNYLSKMTFVNRGLIMKMILFGYFIYHKPKGAFCVTLPMGSLPGSLGKPLYCTLQNEVIKVSAM